jgi:hypothetical protein
MIHHAHKCIFLHIPKTAGTTIESVISGIDWYHVSKGIQKHLTLDGWMTFPRMSQDCGTHREGKIYPKYRFKTKDEIEQIKIDTHNLLNESHINNYFKFTFVRNPFDWVVSWFYWTTSHQKKYKDFNNFVKKYVGAGKEHCTFTSQSRYTLYKGKYCMDFIGKFENFNQDFQVVADKLNINWKNSVHINSNSNKPDVPYWNHYNKESIDIIFNKYQDDLKAFNYDYEG